MKNISLSFDERVLAKLAIEDSIKKLDGLINHRMGPLPEELAAPLHEQIAHLQSVLAKITN